MPSSKAGTENSHGQLSLSLLQISHTLAPIFSPSLFILVQFFHFIFSTPLTDQCHFRLFKFTSARLVSSSETVPGNCTCFHPAISSIDSSFFNVTPSHTCHPPIQSSNNSHQIASWSSTASALMERSTRQFPRTPTSESASLSSRRPPLANTFLVLSLSILTLRYVYIVPSTSYTRTLY